VGNPIFFTKKFAGHPEYRWEVKDVRHDHATAQQTYIVTLHRRRQIDKQFTCQTSWLRAKTLLYTCCARGPIVEVEFGHALTIGKENGDIRSNKRYVDTMQLFSMPKRRLAIVNQVNGQRDELIQVIPISSRQPRADDKAVVEVTSCLNNMVHYQKPSWAICRMMQTVTASRIIAPFVRTTPNAALHDKGFRSLVRGQVRAALKDAIMYGVAADGRVAAAESLSEAKAKIELLDRQTAEMAQKLAHLESQARLYGRWAADEKLTMDDLRELYSE